MKTQHRKPLSLKEQKQLRRLSAPIEQSKYIAREEWSRRLFSVSWKTIERAGLGNPMNPSALVSLQRGLWAIESKRNKAA